MLSRHCKHLLVVVYKFLSHSCDPARGMHLKNHIYIHICICMYIYVYIYIYIYTHTKTRVLGECCRDSGGLSPAACMTHHIHVSVIDIPMIDIPIIEVPIIIEIPIIMICLSLLSPGSRRASRRRRPSSGRRRRYK